MTRALPWSLVSLPALGRTMNGKNNKKQNIRNYRNQPEVERKQRKFNDKRENVSVDNLRFVLVVSCFTVQTKEYWREDKIFNSECFFCNKKALSQLRSLDEWAIRGELKGRMPQGKTTADWYMSMCNLLFQRRASGGSWRYVRTAAKINIFPANRVSVGGRRSEEKTKTTKRRREENNHNVQIAIK